MQLVDRLFTARGVKRRCSQLGGVQLVDRLVVARGSPSSQGRGPRPRGTPTPGDPDPGGPRPRGTLTPRPSSSPAYATGHSIGTGADRLDVVSAALGEVREQHRVEVLELVLDVVALAAEPAAQADHHPPPLLLRRRRGVVQQRLRQLRRAEGGARGARELAHHLGSATRGGRGIWIRYRRGRGVGRGTVPMIDMPSSASTTAGMCIR